MFRLVLYGVGGIIAIAAGLKLIAILLGSLIGILGFVVFRILPLVLIGWLVMKLWKSWKQRPA
ncbi:MAG TPA: hypothetical protein VF188_01295 [Longimicrobiales bacterium]